MHYTVLQKAEKECKKYKNTLKDADKSVWCSFNSCTRWSNFKLLFCSGEGAKQKNTIHTYNRGNCPLGLWELGLPRIHEKLYNVALIRKFLGALQKMPNNQNQITQISRILVSPFPSSSNADLPSISSVDSFRRQSLKNSVRKSPIREKVSEQLLS